MATRKLSIIHVYVSAIYYPSSWTHQLSIILSVQVCCRTCKVARMETC